MTDKYPPFSPSLSLSLSVFRATLLVIFLECVWQKQTDTHKKGGMKAAESFPNL